MGKSYKIWGELVCIQLTSLDSWLPNEEEPQRTQRRADHGERKEDQLHGLLCALDLLLLSVLCG